MRYNTRSKIKKGILYGLIFLVGISIGHIYTGSINDFNFKMDSLIPEKYNIEIIGVEGDSYKAGLMGSEKRISIVKLLIINNKDESLTMAFKKHGIVYEDGDQIGMLTGGLFDTIPCDKCLCFTDEEYIGTFTLLPHGKKSFNLCFSEIDNEKNPKLVISLLEDAELDVQGAGGDVFTMTFEKKGKGKEFIIALKEYL